MPPSSREPSPADFAACRALLRGGSRSFHMASMLLPARVRDATTSLYAFCRVADDAIDESADAAAALIALRERLTRAYAGEPCDHPADRALAYVVWLHAIPVGLLEALLEGFAWDAERRRYESFDDLAAYATRVAGTVGAIMALLMGMRRHEVVARAIDLGIAMQLSNIARDIGADARVGRLYLPLEWLREAGVDPASFMDRPVASVGLARVTTRLLAEADRFYAAADGGIAALPASCRPAIRAARHLYAEIGREVARRGEDAVAVRAVVPLGRKLSLAPRVFAGGPGWAPAGPVLPQAGFLLAVIETSSHAQARQDEAGRVTWLIDLFTRLDQRARAVSA